jgi:hypothetical protein
MELLATSQFYFYIPNIEVNQEIIFSFQSTEGVRTVTSVVRCKTMFSCYGEGSDFRSLVLSALCFGCILDLDYVIFDRTPCAVFVFDWCQGSFLPTRFCPP